MPTSPPFFLENDFILAAPITDNIYVPYDSSFNKKIFLSADKLSDGEKVSVLVYIAGQTNQFYHPDGVTPYQVTSTNTMIELPGGPKYVFRKDGTSLACGVYLDVQRH